MEQKQAMEQMVALAVEDARDDITTSRSDALIRQYMSPAESPHADRQRQLAALTGFVPQERYPELDAMLDVAIRRVRTFLSGAVFELLPRVVIHVGPGFDSLKASLADGQLLNDKVVDQTEKVVGICARYYESQVVPLETVEDLRPVIHAWHAIVSPGAKVLMVPAENLALVRRILRQMALRQYLSEVMLCWYPEAGSESFVRVRVTNA